MNRYSVRVSTVDQTSITTLIDAPSIPIAITNICMKYDIKQDDITEVTVYVKVRGVING